MKAIITPHGILCMPMKKKRTEWARGPEIGTLPCLRCRVLGKQQNKGNFIGRTISNCRLHNV